MTRSERAERLRLATCKACVRTLAAFGAYRLLAWLISRWVTVYRDAQHLPASRADDSAAITVLVLDWQRYRGDLDILFRAGDVRFLCISWRLLGYFLACYVREPTRAEEAAYAINSSTRHEFARAAKGSVIYSERERYRGFLRRLLPALFERLGVDIVMTSDYRFRRELDLIWVASELGYAHVCYFREAMYVVSAIYDKAVDRYRVMAPFRGDVLAVQNAVTGRIFVEAGMASPDQVVVRGCPRMDGYIRSLTAASDRTRRRQVAFFSWPPHVPLQDRSKFDLFIVACDTVRALAELARDDPSIEVVLKIKDQHMKGGGQGQIESFEGILRDVAGARGILPNVRIETERMAAHEVIAGSAVICAMQSTVVLEAAVAGKPVILPHFAELAARRGAEQALMYCGQRHLFDVPHHATDLKALVLRRLNDPAIPAEIQTERRELFQQYVSPLAGRATETSLSLLREVACRARAKRRQRRTPHERGYAARAAS